jgi:hypothetical protein
MSTQRFAHQRVFTARNLTFKRRSIALTLNRISTVCLRLNDLNNAPMRGRQRVLLNAVLTLERVFNRIRPVTASRAIWICRVVLHDCSMCATQIALRHTNNIHQMKPNVNSTASALMLIVAPGTSGAQAPGHA